METVYSLQLLQVPATCPYQQVHLLTYLLHATESFLRN
jgi:hypothetical protein